MRGETFFASNTASGGETESDRDREKDRDSGQRIEGDSDKIIKLTEKRRDYA